MILASSIDKSNFHAYGKVDMKVAQYFHQAKAYSLRSKWSYYLYVSV